MATTMSRRGLLALSSSSCCFFLRIVKIAAPATMAVAHMIPMTAKTVEVALPPEDCVLASTAPPVELASESVVVVPVVPVVVVLVELVLATVVVVALRADTELVALEPAALAAASAAWLVVTLPAA